MFADLNITAKSEEQARNIEKVVNGLIAMLSLVPPDEPEIQQIRKLVEGLTINVDNRDVSIELEIDGDDLLELLMERHDDARREVDEDCDVTEIVVKVEKKEAA